MYRHSPSRNQRSKRFKVKQVLQICVLAAVCLWLIYQVKHSHDKKKAFEESDAKTSLDISSRFIKPGGKNGIQDQLQEKISATENDEKEAEEENGVEEDDSKHEEDELDPEEGNKKEEKEDDMRGGGDDEIDERDHDKSEVEIEHEVDILDEERDREEVDENEENEKEGKETQNKDVSQVKDHDHEAREEHYKGDDASSAVTHESETVSAGTQKGNPENTIEKIETNGLEDGNAANTTDNAITVDKSTTGVVEGKGEIIENGIPVNVTVKEEIVSSKQTTESNNEEETGNDLEKKSMETNRKPMTNNTEVKQDEGQKEISTNPSLNNTRSASNLIDTQNLETLQGETLNTSATSGTVLLGKEKSQQTTVENKNENLESERKTGASETEEGHADHHDPIDDTDSNVSVEKDLGTDFETLPDIRTNGRNDEEVAAE